MTANGFSRIEVNGLAFYVCLELHNTPGIRHAFSTRHGGTSPLPEGALNLSFLPWDTQEHVEQNRLRFLSALELRADLLVTMAQVHSDRIHIIDETPRRRNQRSEGDALMTASRGPILGVQVADCFPILIADPENGAVAGVHSGWRGTHACIVSKTIQALRDRYASNPSRLIVAIGPGISGCCLEVGVDVARLFPADSLKLAKTSDKRMLDLRLLLHRQLGEAGVSRENVHDLAACTKCNSNEFFSYRGEGPESGRMMGVIARV